MQTLKAFDVSIFGIDLSFDSVAFTIPIGDGWDIYWYGILIALGFLLAIIYCYHRAKRFDVNVDRLTDVVLVTAPVAILCARIYYIIFDPSSNKIDSIGEFFGISGDSGVAGLAIYGGVIGAVLCGLLMCKLRKVNVLDAFDLASSGFLIGQAVGRWGNFFNQEAFGSLTSHGMMSNGVIDYIVQNRQNFDGLENVLNRDVEAYITENNLAVHPTFLYESIWCLLGFVLLHFIGKNRKFKGQLALTYGIWYGFGRMIIEGLRTDSLYLGPLKVSQWLSGLLVVVCGIILIRQFLKLRTAKTDITYESVFADIDIESSGAVTYYEGDETAETNDADAVTDISTTDKQDTTKNENEEKDNG